MDMYESEEDTFVPKKRALPKAPKSFQRYVIRPSNDTTKCIALTQGSSDGRATKISEYQYITPLESSLRQAIEVANYIEPQPANTPGHQGQAVRVCPETQAAPIWEQQDLSSRQRLKNSTVCSQMCGSLLHDLLVKQEIIIEQQQNIIRMVQDLHAAMHSMTNGSTTMERHYSYFPLCNIEQLMALEGDLQSLPGLKKELVTSLGLAGGATMKDTVWGILKRAMRNDLALKVTWSGVNGKRAFERLHLKAVVVEAVRRNPACSSATDNEIAKAIKKWFY
ncbi:uncharacterized protein LOC125897577 [Epinephelus fuscoguttatus]|uniref:uncharacterized protein LOC125897577 n=1 Tax=Epinephelus fuscoguttatus TaxID=293821 RepID=UPI0020D1C11B|nr:uncharacterized protein LOC125897577 [Epinephelus fuscoguttatus]